MAGLKGKTESPEEACLALKAMIRACKSKQEPESQANGRGCADGSEKTLRQRRREEFEETCRRRRERSKFPDVLAQLEADVAKAEARLSSKTANASNAAPAPPAAEHQKINLVALAAERVVVPLPSAAEAAPKPIRTLVVDNSCGQLRQAVANTRQHLHDLDKVVTRLTRELKQGRMDMWGHQQRRSVAEANTAKLVASQSGKLSPRMIAEEQELTKTENELRQQGLDARLAASRWFQEAERQDAILQEGRDAQKGTEAHRILAKHPAGEVFLLDNSDSESEDCDSDRPSAPWRQHQQRGRARCATSSDEEPVYKGYTPRAGSESDEVLKEPPAITRQFRDLSSNFDTSEDESANGGNSAVPSPSNNHVNPLASIAEKVVDKGQDMKSSVPIVPRINDGNLAPAPNVASASQRSYRKELGLDDPDEVSSEDGLDNMLESSRSL